ncbi:hypothetical protein ABPG72_000131 [Tetrahymena utriculariae]
MSMLQQKEESLIFSENKQQSEKKLSHRKSIQITTNNYLIKSKEKLESEKADNNSCLNIQSPNISDFIKRTIENEDLSYIANKSENCIITKLYEIMRRIKIKQLVSHLANRIPSRMHKKMTPYQFYLINDKSQDFQDQQNRTKIFFSRLASKKLVFNFFTVFQKFMSIIPILSPSSKYKLIWDTVVSFSLVQAFFFIPILISLSIHEEGLFYDQILQFIIVVEVFDIIITCNTGFYKKGVLCKKRNKILRKYQSEELVNDILFLLPILLYKFFFSKMYNYNYYQFILLSFLLKWKKLSKLYQSIENKYILQPNIRNILSLMNLFFTVLLIAHTFACIWIITGRISYTFYGINNWMSAEKLIDSAWAEKYLYAFYFCTVTMSTVGYGDIVPRSPLERILCSVMIVTSAGIFGFSVNTISGILQDLTKQERNIMDKMYVIKNYLLKKSISLNLSNDITEYLEYYWRQNEEQNEEEEERMVKQLSDQLRNDLLIESNKIILKECQFFQSNFSEELIKSMVNIIQEKNYAPEEIIYFKGDQNQNRAIYFVQEGIVEIFMETENNYHQQNNQCKSIKKLKKGEFFGEIEFFTDVDRQQNIRSVNFTKVLKIDRQDFMQIIKNYPQDYEQFCYVKDKIVNQQDFKKIHLQCHSCASSNHLLDRCPFVNFIPNKPKVILSYNRSQPLFERCQLIRRQKKFYYNQEDLLQILESFQETNEEFLEEYEIAFLTFQISKCDICQSQQQVQSQGQASTINLFSQMHHNSNNNNTIKNNANISKQSYIHILNPSGAGCNTPKKRSNSNLTNEDQISQKINQHKKAYLQNNCMLVSQFGIDDQEVFDSASPIKIVKSFKSNVKMCRIKTKDSKMSKSQSSFNSGFTQEDNFMIQSQNVDIFDKFDNSPNNIQNEKSSFSNSQQSINPQFSNNNIIRQSTLNNNPSKYNNATSILECVQEQTINNSSVIPIKNIKLTYQISHKQILFFDPFQGLFEKMHSFLFYYPLNNYTFVIQQTQMDQIQKKKMKNKLLSQQKAALSKLVLKKQLRKRSQPTKNQPLLRKKTKKGEENISDIKDLKSKFSQNYTNTFTLQNSPFSEIKKQIQQNSILNTEEKFSQFNQKFDEKNPNDLILSSNKTNIAHQISTGSKGLNLSNIHITENKPDIWSFQNLNLALSKNNKLSNFKDDNFEQIMRDKVQIYQRSNTDHQVYNYISNDTSFQNQNIEKQKKVDFSPPRKESKVKFHNFLDLTNNISGYFEDYTKDNQSHYQA